MPIGIENIGWKMYMINGGWDIITLVLIVSLREILNDQRLIYTQAVYWVETKGKTLEEIDAIFDGEKHSSVPDVEDIRTGRKTLNVSEVEKQLQENLGLKAE